jgi:RimJ/RimL family protein N-acetyltransferase
MSGSSSRLFESTRLFARPLTTGDDPLFASLYGDDSSVRYLGMRPLTTDEQVRAHLEKTLARNQAYADRGEALGIWVLVRKDDASAVGIVICNHPRASIEGQSVGEIPLGELSTKIQIGWHLTPDARGYGYATEAGRAVLEYALTELQSEEVYVLTEPEHHKSQAVAERLGLALAGRTREFYDLEMVHFIARATPLMK